MPKYVDDAGLSRFWNNINGSIGSASQEQVDAWLDEHPEATTTVQDGAVTTAKLADGAVTDVKLAQTGGVLDTVSAIMENDQQNNCVDVLLFGNHPNLTDHGATFTWNDDGSCTITGATTSAYGVCDMTSSALLGMLRAGEKYQISHSSPYIYLWLYDGSTSVWINSDREYTMPSSFNMSALHVYLAVDKNKSLGSGVTVNPKMLTAQSNESIVATIDEISATVDGIADKTKKLNSKVVDWSFFGSSSYPLGWRNGTYTSGGVADTGGFYLRTLENVNILSIVEGARYFEVTVPDGYAVAVAEYDTSNSFVARHGNNDIRNATATTKVCLPVTYGHNYKFAVGRWSGANSTEYINDTDLIGSFVLRVWYDYDLNDINSYYFPYLDTVVDEVNRVTKSMGAKSFGFVFITDYHYLRNANQSAKLIHYLLQRTGVHTVVFGGDAFQNWKSVDESQEMINLVYDTLSNCGESDFYCMTGNHEWNDMSGQMNTQSGVNAMTVSRCRFKVPVMDQYGDYYFDDPVTSTRVFVLGTNVSGSIPWNCILWLGSQLGDVPNGSNVLVMAHAGLLEENGVTIQKNTYMNVSKLLGAFDRSESTELFDSDNVSRGTFDYTGKTGTTIGYICGHVHDDLSISKAESENGVLVFSTTGDLYKDESGNKYTFVDDGGNTVTRNVGTVYEQAFDVIQVDTSARAIYCTRVGAGLNREFSY